MDKLTQIFKDSLQTGFVDKSILSNVDYQPELLVNQKHPLVEGLLKLQSGGVIVGDAGQSPSEILAKDLAQHLYETAKLSVGGLDPKELANFQTKNLQLMSRLMERAF